LVSGWPAARPSALASGMTDGHLHLWPVPSQAGQIKLQVQCLRLKPMRLETVDTDQPKGRLAGNLAELDLARQWWASRCSWSGGASRCGQPAMTRPPRRSRSVLSANAWGCSARHLRQHEDSRGLLALVFPRIMKT
jgi:hypothetical protein